jgi:hypothetical protein
VELNPEGTPLGVWRYVPEEENWIFEPAQTPLGAAMIQDFNNISETVKENPETDSRYIIPNYAAVIILSAVIIYLIWKRKNSEN